MKQKTSCRDWKPIRLCAITSNKKKIAIQTCAYSGISWKKNVHCGKNNNYRWIVFFFTFEMKKIVLQPKLETSNEL